jgi:hypothetical protein
MQKIIAHNEGQRALLVFSWTKRFCILVEFMNKSTAVVFNMWFIFKPGKNNISFLGIFRANLR